MSTLAKALIDRAAEAAACESDGCPLLAEEHLGVCRQLAALLLNAGPLSGND